MKWVVTNTVALNGGDAAILFGVLAAIRAVDTEAEVEVQDAHPEVAARCHPELAFRSHPWNAAQSRPWPRLARWMALRQVAGPGPLGDSVRRYRNADVAISTGGTYLVENYRLAPRLFDFELCQASGTPLVLFTQSLGPFTQPPVQAELRKRLGRSPLVLLRDERSRRHLLDIGVPPDRLHVHADVVFALADDAVVGAAGRRTWPDAPRIGVSVRAWRHFRRREPEAGMAAYEASVAAMVERLVKAHRAEILFLSTCQGVPEYGQQDQEVAQRIFERLPPDVRSACEVDADFHPPLSIRDRYGALDLVIATRMHAAILALSAGTPVLPIAYEFKTEALFEQLRQRHRLDIETMTPEASVETLTSFLTDLDGFRPRLFEGVAAMVDSARGATARLAEVAKPKC